MFANVDDGSEIIANGCTDYNYIEFDFEATVDDGSCQELIVYGCTDSTYAEYIGGKC